MKELGSAAGFTECSEKQWCAEAGRGIQPRREARSGQLLNEKMHHVITWQEESGSHPRVCGYLGYKRPPADGYSWGFP